MEITGTTGLTDITVPRPSRKTVRVIRKSRHFLQGQMKKYTNPDLEVTEQHSWATQCDIRDERSWIKPFTEVRHLNISVPASIHEYEHGSKMENGHGTRTWTYEGMKEKLLIIVLLCYRNKRLITT